MPKITLIGAGSVVFTRNLSSDRGRGTELKLTQMALETQINRSL